MHLKKTLQSTLFAQFNSCVQFFILKSFTVCIVCARIVKKCVYFQGAVGFKRKVGGDGPYTPMVLLCNYLQL